MSTTGMPKDITRGYSTSFRSMLVDTDAKALSIQELNALDEADFEANMTCFNVPEPDRIGP